METPKRAYGNAGEEQAARYLDGEGYTLLKRNWRVGHLELDIVADWFGELVFVEVKTRQNEDFAPAYTAVDIEKQHHMVQAAHAYMAYHRLDQPYRFDIITLIGTPPTWTLHHYPNAFTEQSVQVALKRKKWRFDNAFAKD
ncbi:MAG: YraN family protein [Alloprevotella sp.]|nr:YraN family protein [Bacteroidales bacterium]MDY3944185.1 YraN family protein [Alloprevotella sp.]